MALDDIVSEENIKEVEGKPFGIGVKRNAEGKWEFDSGTRYDRKEFVERAGDLFDVEDYHKRLRENSGDMDALKDLSALAANYMAGDPQENISQLMENPHLALDQANALLDSGYTSMAKFVEINRNSLLNKLSAEQLYRLFSRVPLYKTGDKKHDRTANLRNKLIQMQQAAQKGEDATSVVGEELDELIKRLPDEQRVYVYRNQHLVIPSLGRVVQKMIQKEFYSLFRDKDGKLDKKELIRYLERNYQVAEDFMKDITDEKEKFDYWDKNLKGQYVEIARENYPSAKAEQKGKDNPEKEERKERARALGIAA